MIRKGLPESLPTGVQKSYFLPGTKERNVLNCIRLYARSKKYVAEGTKRTLLEDLRKVLGLKSVKGADENVIQEPPLSLWANFQHRALDVALLEITKKTDIRISVQSLERSAPRKEISVNFSIKDQALPKGRLEP